MPPQRPLEALRSALGEDAVELHDPLTLDGVELDATLRPRDGDALARGLECLTEAGGAVVIRGGATRLGVGNPPRGAGLLLSTERLAGLEEFDPGEGVCRAGAGTPLAALRAALEPHGWDVPLDPPGEAATLGGALAAAAVGPRALGFGLPRDVVLGLDVVLASGERTRCGGRVVKNVTGYDMAKLYTGSLGTLGVIESVWLRLRPRAEATRVLAARAAAGSAACALGIEAAQRLAARAVALLGAAEDAEDHLLVELAGDSVSVERDADWLSQRCAAAPQADSALDEIRARQAGTPAPGGLRFRLAVPASALAGAVAELRTAGAHTLVYPGLGLVYAGFPAAAAAAFAAVERVAAGAWLLEEAPLAAKLEHDVFGGAQQTLPLARALKQRFDPQGVLNPGRFQGRL